MPPATGLRRRADRCDLRAQRTRVPVCYTGELDRVGMKLVSIFLGRQAPFAPQMLACWRLVMHEIAARPVVVPWQLALAALLALAGLFVLGFDQGQTLA